MKIHILSDLHTELADFEPEATGADVVVVAGDIGVGLKALDWVHDRFGHQLVVYVLGNHEYYSGDLNLIDDFKRAASSNVHILDNESVILDGVRFLGTTLWTDFALFGLAERHFAIQAAAETIADFRQISQGEHRFAPIDSIAIHKKSVAWLSGQLLTPFDGDTVVVTHHAPSWLSIAERFKKDSLSPAFASRLESLMEAGEPALWIHGHTHDAFDYQVYETRVVCNPRGYLEEFGRYGFRADLVVELQKSSNQP